MMKQLFSVGLASLMATSAFAQNVQAPSIFDRILSKGITVVTSFPAGDGMTGWILKRPDGELFLTYTTPNNQYVLTGPMFDSTGQDLTQRYQAAHFPAPEHLAELRNAPAIVVGPESNERGTVYVFTDPLCPHCATAYKGFKPLTQSGLQVRYLLVALRGPASESMSEKILSSADPAAALDLAQIGYPNVVVPSAKASDRTSKILAANAALMRKLNLTGTPGVAYVRSGKLVVKEGAPQGDDYRRIALEAGR